MSTVGCVYVCVYIRDAKASSALPGDGLRDRSLSQESSSSAAAIRLCPFADVGGCGDSRAAGGGDGEAVAALMICFAASMVLPRAREMVLWA